MESIFLLPKTKGVFDMELKAIQLTKQYGSKTAVNHLNLSLSNEVKRSSIRRRLDAELDKLNDKELSIVEATVSGLCKAKEPEE